MKESVYLRQALFIETHRCNRYLNGAAAVSQSSQQCKTKGGIRKETALFFRINTKD